MKTLKETFSVTCHFFEMTSTWLKPKLHYQRCSIQKRNCMSFKISFGKFIWLENLPLDSAWRVGIIKSSRDTLLSGLILRRHSENEIRVSLREMLLKFNYCLKSKISLEDKSKQNLFLELFDYTTTDHWSYCVLRFGIFSTNSTSG